MVDQIGSKGTVTGDLAPVRVTRVAAPPPTPAPAREAPLATAGATARAMAAEPPVDAERVRRIKAAVEGGTFPISPATIADRLIALRYEWMSDDEA